jgi:hypothetical protein
VSVTIDSTEKHCVYDRIDFIKCCLDDKFWYVVVLIQESQFAAIL